MAENVNYGDYNNTLSEVEESGLCFSVCTNSSPRKTNLYYNKELRLERLLILNLLSEYIRRGKSVLKPVRCLDAGSGVGINGFLWKKYITNGIEVSISTPHSSAVNTIMKNAEKNGLTVNVMNYDTCILLNEKPFNFIHIDCHTEASHYFDAAFKNLARNGVLVITTKDDSSLYGRNAEAALRNYGGVITKTSYGTELGIRLVIAAMARSAAKYSKAVRVLCCASFKNAFMIAVTLTKGPLKANRTFHDIRRLLHCSMCEERAFYPDTNGFVLENPATLLSCNCSTSYAGKVIMDLGPVWSGEIFDADYLTAMTQDHNIPSKELVNAFTTKLISETRLPSSKQLAENNNSESPPKKIMKFDDKISKYDDVVDDCETSVTPPFYYNLPRHSQKAPHLMPLEKVIQALNKAGFKANRTHFDRHAVRTNANAQQLMKIIQNIRR